MKILIALGLVTIGCGSSEPQVVSGRVAQNTFTVPIDHVAVIQAGSTVTQAPVAADGAFTLSIPTGSGYRIELSSAASRAGLVSPRTSGTLDKTFTVRGHTAAFDLGAVRYIGDPTMKVFKQTGTTTGDGDGECEDGIDPTTNAVCVDDAEEGAQTCDGETNDGETNDNGTEDGTNDGETADDGPADAAVADHNLPSAIGCDGGDGDGESND